MSHEHCRCARANAHRWLPCLSAGLNLLHCCIALQIQQLKKYVGLKLRFDSYRNLEIVILAREDPDPKAALLTYVLDDELTLQDVCQSFTDGENDPVLYFRIPTAGDETLREDLEWTEALILEESE